MTSDPTDPIISKLSKKKVSMLPPISENAADSIYFWGNVALLLAAVLGLLGGFAVFWGDRVRDYYSDQRQSKIEETTHSLEKKNITALEKQDGKQDKAQESLNRIEALMASYQKAHAPDLSKEFPLEPVMNLKLAF